MTNVSMTVGVLRRRVAAVSFRALILIAMAGLIAGYIGVAPAAASGAQLTLTRVSGLLYAGAPATVKVNGKEVASLWGGASSTVNIAPGANTVTVDAWSYPGNWTLNLKVKPGARYTIEISPRDGSYVESLVLGGIGAAVNASINKNTGAFQMKVVTAR